MKRRLRTAILCAAAALLLGACAGEPKFYHSKISDEPLEREFVYYSQVKTSSDSTMGVIYHVNAKGDITPLASNVDEAFWKRFVLALTGVAGQVGAAAIHGISFPRAQSTVSAVASGNTTTNTNTATGGKVCTESGAGDLTGC